MSSFQLSPDRRLLPEAWLEEDERYKYPSQGIPSPPLANRQVPIELLMLENRNYDLNELLIRGELETGHTKVLLTCWL